MTRLDGFIIENDGSQRLSRAISHEVANGFDYSTMPPLIATKAREAIDTFHRGHGEIVQTVVIVGLALLDVRDALDHGLFGQWLKAEFGAGERTAQNYMNVARRFGDKTEIISNLPLTVAYQLAAPNVSDEARQDIVARIERECIAAPEIVGMIQQAKDDDKERRAAEREKIRLSKFKPEEAKAEKNRGEARRRARERRDAEHEKERTAFRRKQVNEKKREIQAARLIVDAIGSKSDELAALLASDGGSHGRLIYALLQRLGPDHSASSYEAPIYEEALRELDGGNDGDLPAQLHQQPRSRAFEGS